MGICLIFVLVIRQISVIAVWVLFGLLCTSIGLYPIAYLVAREPISLLLSKPPSLLGNVLWQLGFYTHIIFGGLALLTGWTQFPRKFRLRYPIWHRRLGMVYTIAVMLSGIAGLGIAFWATGGLVPAIGFIGLGLVWLYTTSQGYLFARNHQFDAHERMMIFSYAACFAAVALRLYLPLLVMLFKGDFVPAYSIVAWLCWVPNMLVAYLIVKRKTQLR